MAHQATAAATDPTPASATAAAPPPPAQATVTYQPTATDQPTAQALTHGDLAPSTDQAKAIDPTRVYADKQVLTI